MQDQTELKDAKILIVDDTPSNLDLLCAMLAPVKCKIFFATGGEQALHIAAEVAPDIVLLDVMMPRMDGFETCRRMQANGAMRDIPVIFVTAKNDVEDLARGFEAGAVDYVTKPVKQPEVLARVRTHLKIRGLIKQQRGHLASLEQAKKELESLNETKDKFLSNLGKEIGSAARRLGATGADEEARKTLRLLETILEWPRLQAGQKLDLLSTRLNDRELGDLLESLQGLRFLSLAETRVGDRGLDHLRPLSQLQELHLDYTEITDRGLEKLAALPNLKILDLKGTKISDRGLAALSGLRGLTGLYLTRTPITDAGLEHISPLKELETLILWDTAVTDAGLVHLEPLTKLKELILWNTRVTKEGVERLQTHLPDCDASNSMF
jgi:DNA-binding response OmpR family regulator